MLEDINDGLKILDCSLKMQPTDPDAFAAFCDTHIPSAQFFDMRYIGDVSSKYPHTCPSVDDCKAHMERLDIKLSDRVVVYDGLIG